VLLTIINKSFNIVMRNFIISEKIFTKEK